MERSTLLNFSTRKKGVFKLHEDEFHFKFTHLSEVLCKEQLRVNV